MKRPSRHDMDLAAEWLQYNTGANGEREACSRVATWLQTYAIESSTHPLLRNHIESQSAKEKTVNKGENMELLCSANDLQDLMLVAQQASDFLERLRAHLIANGDDGQGGNCTIQMHKLRKALALVDPPV